MCVSRLFELNQLHDGFMALGAVSSHRWYLAYCLRDGIPFIRSQELPVMRSLLMTDMWLLLAWSCRFRDQALTELLESVYGMMGYSFLAALREGLSSASSWETAEGALYCLWAVRQAARDRAAQPSTFLLKVKPDSQATAQQTNEVRWRTSLICFCRPVWAAVQCYEAMRSSLLVHSKWSSIFEQRQPVMLHGVVLALSCLLVRLERGNILSPCTLCTNRRVVEMYLGGGQWTEIAVLRM